MNVRKFILIVTLCVGYFAYRIGSGLDVTTVICLPSQRPLPATGADRMQPALRAEIAASDLAWQNMVTALNETALRYQGRVGIYLKDMRTGRIWAHYADNLFPSASLIKIPVMASVFERVRQGEMTLNTRLVLRRRGRAGGSGSLKWRRDGTIVNVRELLDKMILESDNTAMKMLVNRMGMYYLQQQFAKFGLAYTQIYPEGLSLTSGRVSYENYTTAREMAYLLEKIYRGQLVDRFSSELMLNILKHNKGHSRLAKHLPIGWGLGRKTGLLRKSCHDVGIIFSPRGEYILAVLTGQLADYKTAKNFISKVAKITFDYYGRDDSMLVQSGNDLSEAGPQNGHL